MSYWTLGELESVATDLFLQYAAEFPEPAGEYEFTPALERERLYGRMEAFALLLGCPIGTPDGNAEIHREINLAREFLARTKEETSD